jgi:GxxExxY protein
MFEPIPMEVEKVARAVVDAAYIVHKELGPGLLESIYEKCLVHELRKRSLRVKQQVSVPIVYNGLTINNGLRMDILVEDCVVVEVKAVEQLLPVHMAQIITYLKLSHIRLGFIINFCSSLIKQGIKRVVV